MKILIVEDHAPAREALTSVALEAFGTPSIHFAGSFAQAVQKATDAHALDMVLLDLDLPDCEGIDTLTRFREAHPAMPVVALSDVDDRACAMAAVEGGAAGFLMKTLARPLISAVLRLVAAGGIYIPRELMVRSDAAPRTLTDRQIDVLRLIGKGLANKQIAERLRIAEDTVKQHARAAYAALGVSSRTQALSVVAQRGIALD